MMLRKVIFIGGCTGSFSHLSEWCSVPSLSVRHRPRRWRWTPSWWCFLTWYSTISWFSVSSVSHNWALPVQPSVHPSPSWYRWFSLSSIPGSGSTARSMHWISCRNSKAGHWSGFSMSPCGQWFRTSFLYLPGLCSSCSWNTWENGHWLSRTLSGMCRVSRLWSPWLLLQPADLWSATLSVRAKKIVYGEPSISTSVSDMCSYCRYWYSSVCFPTWFCAYTRICPIWGMRPSLLYGCYAQPT